MGSFLSTSLPFSFPGSEGWELPLPIQTQASRREPGVQPLSLPLSSPTLNSPSLFSQPRFCPGPRTLILKLRHVKLKGESYKLDGYSGEFQIWFERPVRFPRALGSKFLGHQLGGRHGQTVSSEVRTTPRPAAGWVARVRVCSASPLCPEQQPRRASVAGPQL